MNVFGFDLAEATGGLIGIFFFGTMFCFIIGLMRHMMIGVVERKAD